VSGSLITIRGKWRLKCKRHNVACDRTSRNTTLCPPRFPDLTRLRLILMGIRERLDIPTSDATVPSRANSQVIANVDGSIAAPVGGGGIRYHVEICRVTNGAHIEHFQINVMTFHAVFKLFHACNYNRF
jgi:hypothetical protein